MNKRSVGYAIGKLLQVMALVLVIPLLIGIYYDTRIYRKSILLIPEVTGFFLGITVSFILGLLLTYICRKQRGDIGVPEGYSVVTIGWLTLSAVGSLPMFFYFIFTSDAGSFPEIIRLLTDSFFETMSGFTTTGSTILIDVESLPRGILFWRSMTHWLGGMGIITLALAIFPAMGVSGYGMYKGEVPGPTKERLQPRLSESAKILWGVYLFFTFTETLLLTTGGMPLYDAFCHTFGTLATGGFSTQNLSIGQYDNFFFHWVIIVFMVFSGMNYLIHYRILFKSEIRYSLQDRELRFYLATLVVAVVFVTGMLYFKGVPPAEESYLHYRHDKASLEDFRDHVERESRKVSSPGGAFSHAAFQVVSILTTTGYCTADFDVWPETCRYLLLVLMFWGGCAGSTGGGLKIIRIMTVFSISWREIKKLARPRWIPPMKIAGLPTSENQIINILALFNLFIIMFIICTALMTLMTGDLVTAVSCVAATLCNIGPGLNGVGAVENYAWLPIPAKWLLSACMLMGRLEIFSVLVVLQPSIWKK